MAILDADRDEEETSSRRSFLANGVGVTGGLALAPHVVGATGEPTRYKEDTATQSVHGQGEKRGDETADLNEADIEFLQQMITHHWGAVTMAELVPSHSNREPLVELAEQMRAAQSDQIDRMEEILKDADVDYQTGNVPEASEIPGMPSQDGMATLRTVDGSEFDLTFINLMTAHHRGALILAKRILEEGRSETIAEMSRDMIAAQKAEIYTLYEWYLEWAPSPDSVE